jgi:DNA-binding response OmpR family regulator/glycine cleavage system H lipoate-binding protein
MSDNPRLLVVDDEEVICQACRRIFSRQGFQVEVNTDACEGLNCALRDDYAAILLDIKMPKIDGIQFLERLRETKPDQPVLIMTGYPSIPNASAAIRLGASDYVTKPFTPEEITRSVQRIVGERRSKQAEAPTPADGQLDPQGPRSEEVLFLDESWFRLELDDSACVGAVLPGLRGETLKAARLPRIGQVVYQGLPLAALTVAGKPMVVIRSPVSGVVAGVNDALADEPALVAADPCGQGWIACLCTTRFEEEVKSCKSRHVLLVNADPCSADAQRQRLSSLGCRVCLAGGPDDVTAAMRDADCGVLLIDAASCGAGGPELVARVNAQSPATKIVVIASARDQSESDYRGHRIFYYAVEPFADNEIADILDAAFRPPEPHPAKAHPARGGSDPIGSIAITNRNGHKVCLLAAPGLLRRSEGLGCRIGQELLAGAFPLVMMPGEANITASAVLKAAGACDRVMVLLAQDSGLLPGSLSRDTKAEFGMAPGESVVRVTTLAVQPDSVGGLAGLDGRTTAALAGHIVREMASY